MSQVAPYAKAVVGFLVAGLTALAAALDDGTITAQEWVTVAIAALGTLAAVWAVPNAHRPPPPIAMSRDDGLH